MARLDHVAYRVADRWKTANFFISAFGYKLQEEFDIEFDDGTTAKCIALEPPEKTSSNMPWTMEVKWFDYGPHEYHLAPEIFVSDGSPGSIVGDWVAARNGVGGIHHCAYMVNSVEATVKEWQEKGYAEFSTEKPIICEDPHLVQIFTKPSALTGVIYEFIERGDKGFCGSSVKQLMIASQNV